MLPAVLLVPADPPLTAAGMPAPPGLVDERPALAAAMPLPAAGALAPLVPLLAAGVVPAAPLGGGAVSTPIGL